MDVWPCKRTRCVFVGRLDAGTFGTMGVGLGFAVAAAAVERGNGTGQRVVCVEGDSAFGFSGMEVETMCRCVASHSSLSVPLPPHHTGLQVEE